MHNADNRICPLSGRALNRRDDHKSAKPNRNKGHSHLSSIKATATREASKNITMFAMQSSLIRVL